MSGSSEDKETVRRLFDAFDAVDADTIRELLSPDFVAHSMPPGLTKDREGFLELARQWRAGFSHEDATLNELLAADNGRVVVRFTSRATHTGVVFGVPASNRTITLTGIDIYAVADGKVTDWWGEINLSELFNTPEGVTSEAGESVE